MQKKSKKKKRDVVVISLVLSVILLTSCGKVKESGSDNVSEKKENTDMPVTSTEIPQYEGYYLLWNDEFDGDSLNTDIWNCELREPGWTNNELQEYTNSDQNIYLEDGQLILKAEKTMLDSGSNYYTSGKVQTQNHQDFLYGKIVVSAKVPEGQGLWPAIWMMPTDESFYGQWPKCGEIDIMEVLGNDTTKTYSTIHYGEPHAEQQGTYTLSEGSFSDSFHEYSVEWEPGEMRFYTDDVLVLTVNDWFTAVNGEDEKPYPAPFNQTFFLQMNLAVGGNWPGNPDDSTDFDQAKFCIDYVRVYQKASYDTNVSKPERLYREPLADGNYLYNGDFAEAEALDDEEVWSYLQFNGGEGSAVIENQTLVISTVTEGTEEYSIQIVQPELPMIKGNSYRVTFEACATEERKMIVCISAPTAGWIRYLPDTSLALNTEWQSYTYEFSMTAKDGPNGRLEFNMGNQGSTATVSIRNVRIEKIQ